MGTVALTVIVMGVTGLVAALVLYFVAKRFYVYEDPRIAAVEALLPGANCGGCGFSGCHAFACACCSTKSLEGLACPGAGNEGMKKIASLLGLAAVASQKKVAVVRCDGTCSLRPDVNVYDGVKSCAIEAAFYSGESACAYGCLGCGDCAAACPYDALHIDAITGLPQVDAAKCTGCGKCAATCPRGIIELAPLSDAHSLVWVACRNHDKGAVAMKECDAACIGCGKCMRVCPSEAVKVTDFLAQISYDACTGCGKCVEACPRKSIVTTAAPTALMNMPE